MSVKGVSLTDEHKRKISEGNKGVTKKWSKPMEQWQKDFISSIHKGIPKTDEQKAKMRDAKLGDKNYIYGTEGHIKGRKAMNDGVNNRWIKEEDIEEYLNNGFVMGRIRKV